MTLRVSAFTRYGPLGASSRVRWLQFLPKLQSQGVLTRTEPLLDDAYLVAKYGGRSTATGIAKAYAARLGGLRAALSGADLIWVEKELWPWMPARLELAALRGSPLVLDFDDAIFHNYDLHRLTLARRLYGGKIDALMRRADLVTAGNDYLAERARDAGACRVEILPTVVDLDAYPLPPDEPDAAPKRPLRLGWIGSPATVSYVRELGPALAELAQRREILLCLIGARLELPGVRVECSPWSQDSEAKAIAGIDIGLMPLLDSPWEQGKCGYKLIQYMACGKPVVASPVGVNKRIVQDGVNGFLAVDRKAWIDSLETLAADNEVRRRFGRAGRAMVESDYSLQVAAPRLAGLFHELVGRRG